jgi:serine/threonine-protein kinase HipA
MKKANNNCLYCYKALNEGQNDFHPQCCKLFFGLEMPPILSLSKEELIEMAKEITNRSVTIPGVQPKLSLNLDRDPDDPKKLRLTIVGLWGQFILKPQVETFKSLPENEDLTMHLAELAGIKTASHTLLRTTSGQLIYVTKRFDRVKGKKIPMEDFCQLMEVPSTWRSKYDNGTMEQVGKTIAKYSSAPGMDLITYFDISVFSFLIGNSDLHLKNLSMIKNSDNQYRLSPAYDLISSNLVMNKDDKEQLALHLNGKKNKIRRKDFIVLATNLKIAATITDKIFSKYQKLLSEFKEFIQTSFLDEELKKQYIQLIIERGNALNIPVSINKV